MRIEWDPLDVAIATCLDGVVRIHEGASVHVHARDVLDMRWLADGPILTIDRRGYVIWTRDRVVVDQRIRVSEFSAFQLFDATLSAGGDRLIALDKAADYDMFYLFVVSLPSLVSFRPKIFTDVPISRRVVCALSGNGATLAVGFASDPGRGFAIVDIATWAPHEMSQDNRIITRNTSAHPIDPQQRLRLELDYAGKRLAQALPEHEPALGVIRIGKGDNFRRELAGGMTAVAVDRSGELVAYAHREVPAGARGRLRFDYLDPNANGGVVVDILDTQTLESDLPDLVALAFSHDRRRLACLSSTGAIEIVPVP